ncbi:nitrous oxide reductase accessory protein NosL [Aureibacillus halotolerans]|uniref:Copper chaperone NosL n=1 Tax=Aureibacillus halotolerans TaxID=1508390 RepID=A0A4V3D4C5_9BACI|nr:nitrous oxide reductase accessory protein NosL [Aureibacillus halotolerans]TDQ34616.1 copper chaperone NosL [Aureibacillus halotolerans]
MKMVNANFMRPLVFLFLLVALVACNTTKAYEPEPINEETDKCPICNMSVKDDQYATQIITEDGRALKFDDIGCMNKWKDQNSTEAIGAEFVRDFDSMEWIPYEDATYVYGPEIKTPMAYGVISFDTKEAAEAYINEHSQGEIMTAEDLKSHSWEVNMDMMMEGMDMEGHSHDHSEDAGSMDMEGHSNDHSEDTSMDMDKEMTEEKTE